MTMVFSSVTYALKAQRLLDSHRVYTSLVRSSGVTAIRGCGYGLRLAHAENASRAMNILASSGINVLGTTEDG